MGRKAHNSPQVRARSRTISTRSLNSGRVVAIFLLEIHRAGQVLICGGLSQKA